MRRSSRTLLTALCAGLLTAGLVAALMIDSGLAFAAPPSGKGPGGGDDGGGGDTAPPYSITFLGTLGGDWSRPEGINGYGDVVGASETGVIGARTWPHAFVNTGDGGGGRLMIDLHDLFEDEELIPPFDYTAETGWIVHSARDINDAGQIAGKMMLLDGGQAVEGTNFRYTPPTVDENGDPVAAQLDTTGSSHPSAEFATAINAHGDMAGYVRGADALVRAFVWIPAGPIVDLGLMDGRETRGLDINDSGQVCGDNNGFDRAWRFTPDVGYEDLGTLFEKAKSTSNWALSINNSGQVAGNSQDKRPSGVVQRGFRYTDGSGLLNLGTLGGNVTRAESINNFGDVVGISETSGGELHVFLYTDVLGLVDLEASITNLDSSSELHGPNGAGRVLINDFGEVAGDADGEAYLLTPVE
ncbi:MAG TPA: hypothetical protein VML55_13250 [Planctomycetaceae bacterium]|nr:hypothetical protein [Planctomycetaceae bacterium]